MLIYLSAPAGASSDGRSREMRQQFENWLGWDALSQGVRACKLLNYTMGIRGHRGVPRYPGFCLCVYVVCVGGFLGVRTCVEAKVLLRLEPGV